MHCKGLYFPGNNCPKIKNNHRTQTDTGKPVEKTKANEKTMLKELGKLPP